MAYNVPIGRNSPRLQLLQDSKTLKQGIRRFGVLKVASFTHHASLITGFTKGFEALVKATGDVAEAITRGALAVVQDAQILKVPISASAEKVIFPLLKEKVLCPRLSEIMCRRALRSKALLGQMRVSR